MKITVETVPGAKKEIILRCEAVDEEVQQWLTLFGQRARRVPVSDGGELVLLPPEAVLYCESVDARTFVYTPDAVYPSASSLSSLAADYSHHGFFRCSKSMVINLNALISLKSGDHGRILAQLNNGERIIVSRRYAHALRSILKGGEPHE